MYVGQRFGVSTRFAILPHHPRQKQAIPALQIANHAATNRTAHIDELFRAAVLFDYRSFIPCAFPVAHRIKPPGCSGPTDLRRILTCNASSPESLLPTSPSQFRGSDHPRAQHVHIIFPAAAAYSSSDVKKLMLPSFHRFRLQSPQFTSRYTARKTNLRQRMPRNRPWPRINAADLSAQRGRSPPPAPDFDQHVRVARDFSDFKDGNAGSQKPSGGNWLQRERLWTPKGMTAGEWLVTMLSLPDGAVSTFAMIDRSAYVGRPSPSTGSPAQIDLHMSPGVTRPGAMLRAAKTDRFVSFTALTCPNRQHSAAQTNLNSRRPNPSTFFLSAVVSLTSFDLCGRSYWLALRGFVGIRPFHAKLLFGYGSESRWPSVTTRAQHEGPSRCSRARTYWLGSARFVNPV